MTHSVYVFGTEITFEVPEGKTVLDAAVDSGVGLPHECTLGNCGTCRVKLQEGSVAYRDFPPALTKEEVDQGYALICQAYADSDLVITTEGPEGNLPESAFLEAEIQKIRPLTQDIYHMNLHFSDDEDIEYLPGQHMNICLPLDHGVRSFSMASAYPLGNEVDFHIRRVEAGYFTDRVLKELNAGDKLEVEIPRGGFCYHPRDWRPMIFVATGTGYAPIRAILESLLDDEDCPPVTLYWGMREESDLYAKRELESWADRIFEFKFVPVLSRADKTWKGRRGYVQSVIEKDFQDVSEYSFYICGSPNMVVDTKETIIKKGADVEYIYAESFTPHA